MCGIVGAATALPAETGWLGLSCDEMKHRGPDGRGVWESTDSRVALGHRRLSIIDLSAAGNQPMADGRGGLEITLNGEIYNYRELREELRGAGHSFRSASDTEVLLEAYNRWGTDCLSHLNGMFAFALYDSKRRTLFLARDRAGEKPLFYHRTSGRIAFASELKALMRDPKLSRVLDPAALDHYLAYGYVPGSLTLLRGIKKLPPGHALLYDLDADSLKEWQYWSLPEFAGGDTGEEQELLAELEDLLADSVKRQLVADVPVGVLLSGGIDSSLVTAFASRVSSGAVRTYNVSFPGHGIYDEASHAKLIASHFGTRHTELVAEPASIDLLPKLARQYDEPVGDSSMIPTFLISELVRESCTVALGGDGGDELFGGYTHYRRYLNQVRFRELMPTAVKTAAASAAVLLPKGFRGRNYLRGLRRSDSDGWVEATLHFDARTRRQLAPLTREAGGEAPESFRKRAGASGETLLQRMTRSDFNTYLPEDILVKVDRSSMLASLEMRAPFLDYRILEFAFSRVPDSLRATPTEQKILLRKLAARVLPPAADLRRKQGFSIPLDAWFAKDWGAYLGSVLRDAPAKLFAPRAVNKLLAEQAKGFPLGQRLFNLAFLELWRREHDITLPA